MHYTEEAIVNFQKIASEILKNDKIVAKQYRYSYPNSTPPLYMITDACKYTKREGMDTLVLGCSLKQWLKDKIEKDMDVKIIDKNDLLVNANLDQIVEADKYLTL